MKNLKITSVLKNDWYNDANISNEDLVIYTMAIKNAIWRDMDNNELYSIANINDMTLRLTKTSENKNNRRWHKIIRDSLKSLIQLNMVHGVYDMHQNETEVDNINAGDNFYIKTELIDNQFFILEQDEIDRLFDKIKSTKISKFAIIRYYIATQRVINCNENFGYLAQRYIAFINNFRTIGQYNDILNNDFCLINNEYVSPSRQFHTTFFGRIGDDENFKMQIEVEASKNNLIKGSKKNIKK